MIGMSRHASSKYSRLKVRESAILPRQTYYFRTIRTDHARRWTSHTAPISCTTNDSTVSKAVPSGLSRRPASRRPLQTLRTSYLVRSLLLGQCFASPQLLKVALRLMKWVVNSKIPWINPDKNVILGAILRRLIYDQFCAGVTPAEVKSKVAEIKSAGFSGVILGFSREIVMDDVEGKQGVEGLAKAEQKCIDEWLQANLETLNLIGPGDYMNIKYTGAGPTIGDALLRGKSPPAALTHALDIICKQAKLEGKRIWVDAEQQAFQQTIDDWTITLMRRHNRGSEAVISNTIQAYLKASRANVLRHLQLARSEGWICGIKLVRGAYIQSDIRERIWDTKEETDQNYNAIVRDILSKSFDTVKKDVFPKVDLFVAGHNKESIRRASELVSELVANGEQLRPVAYGQLQGMADDVSFDLVQLRKDAMNSTGLSEEETGRQIQTAPRPYKCLNWGTVGECMHFLMRRAVENGTALDRLQHGLTEVKSELRTRFGWPNRVRK